MKLLEVKLKKPDDFLKVAETLKRIGQADFKVKTLKQPVYILHKNGQYFITHYTEMLVLDRVLNEVPQDGLAIRNTVAHLLEEWNLLEIVKPEWSQEPLAPMSAIKVIPFRDKAKWTLIPIYEIGKARNPL